MDSEVESGIKKYRKQISAVTREILYLRFF